jgi:predicted nucleic acid-binding protein
MLVIDAGALGDLLLGDTRVADTVAGQDLHAPHLIDVEVLSALRRLVAAGTVQPARAAQAVTDLLDLPIERYAHASVASRIWELRDNFSAYDAAYVALAEALSADGATLLTADLRLARAVRGHSDADVRVVD